MATSTDEDLDFYAEIINVPYFWSCLAVAGFILSMVIVVSNGALLLTIYKDPRRSFRTPPNFLIANLSASEFLQGAIALFLVALRDAYRYYGLTVPYSKVFKVVIYIVVCTTLFVNSATIIALSISCYVAINSPVVYKSTITTKRIKIAIALIWIIAVLMSFLPATNIPEKTYTLIYLHTLGSIPAILFTLTYVKVFRALTRRKHEARQSFKASRAATGFFLARRRNMALVIIAILVSFYITFIPQYITLHLLYLCKTCQESIAFSKINVVLSRFLFINSALDPFIYAWRVPKYRRALRDCLRILKKNVISRFETQQVGKLSLSIRNNRNEVSYSSGL